MNAKQTARKEKRKPAVVIKTRGPSGPVRLNPNGKTVTLELSSDGVRFLESLRILDNQKSIEDYMMWMFENTIHSLQDSIAEDLSEVGEKIHLFKK